MARFKDVEWTLQTGASGGPLTWQQAEIAVLMDIRDELKRLNTLLHCHNFTDIPTILRGVRRNTTKPKRAKTKVATTTKGTRPC